MINPEVQSLYKYQSISKNSLSLLINKSIWLSKPDTFNDPFDGTVELQSATSVNDFKKRMESTGTAPEEIDKYANQLTEDKLVKINDVMKTYSEKMFLYIQQAGVYSLTRSNDNILMWSHYGEEHKGFCIEYKRNETNQLGNENYTRPVEYEIDYPIIKSLDSMATEKLTEVAKELICIKAENWKYEKEWRMMVFEKGNIEIPRPAAISAIIFGCKTSDNNKKVIKNILSKEPEIEFKQAMMVKNQFKLIIE